MYRDQVLLSTVAGQANLSSGALVTSETLFRVGSITKVFPTLLALQAVHKGIIRLDDPVSATVPDFVVANPWGDGVVTWRLLLTQRSGLPREAPPGDTTAEVLGNISAWYALGYPPGGAPSYSNLGFALVGNLVGERLLGMDFASAAQKYIFTPLGMNDTGLEYTPEVMRRLAVGYTDTTPRQDGGFAELGWGAPAGAAYSTARDLNVFLQAIMATARGESTPLGISAQAARAWMDIDFVNQGAASAWGLPWEVQILPNGFIARTKGGSLGTYLSTLVLIPELSLSYAGVWNGPQNTPGQAAAAVNALAPALNATLWENLPSPLYRQGNVPTEGMYLLYGPAGPSGPALGLCVYNASVLGMPVSPISTVFELLPDSPTQIVGLGWMEFSPVPGPNLRYARRLAVPQTADCQLLQELALEGTSLLFTPNAPGQEQVEWGDVAAPAGVYLQGLLVGQNPWLPRVGPASACYHGRHLREGESPPDIPTDVLASLAL